MRSDLMHIPDNFMAQMRRNTYGCFFATILCVITVIVAIIKPFSSSVASTKEEVDAVKLVLMEDKIRSALRSFKLSEYKVVIYPVIITYACKKYMRDWKEIVSLFLMESWFDTYAVGDSLIGFTEERARGMQQNIPSTAKESAKDIGMPYHKYLTEHNPVFGIISGTYTLSCNYLIWGTQEKALKAYIMGNAGLRKYYERDKRARKLYKDAKVDESWKRFCKFYNALERQYGS